MRFISNSVEDTLRLGRSIARHVRKGDCLCLYGELGSGKTVLTKGIAAGLGIHKSRLISPTFILFRIYDGKKLSLYHFDFYRLSGVRDIVGLGYEEYFYGNGVTVIEWPQRLGFLLPHEHLRVELSIQGAGKRMVTIRGEGLRYRDLMRSCDEAARH